MLVDQLTAEAEEKEVALDNSVGLQLLLAEAQAQADEEHESRQALELMLSHERIETIQMAEQVDEMIEYGIQNRSQLKNKEQPLSAEGVQLPLLSPLSSSLVTHVTPSNEQSTLEVSTTAPQDNNLDALQETNAELRNQLDAVCMQLQQERNLAESLCQMVEISKSEQLQGEEDEEEALALQEQLASDLQDAYLEQAEMKQEQVLQQEQVEVLTLQNDELHSQNQQLLTQLSNSIDLSETETEEDAERSELWQKLEFGISQLKQDLAEANHEVSCLVSQCSS